MDVQGFPSVAASEPGQAPGGGSVVFWHAGAVPFGRAAPWKAHAKACPLHAQRACSKKPLVHSTG